MLPSREHARIKPYAGIAQALDSGGEVAQATNDIDDPKNRQRLAPRTDQTHCQFEIAPLIVIDWGELLVSGQCAVARCGFE